VKKIALGLFLAVTVLLPGVILSVAPAFAQQAPPTDSAVTVSGTGEFANLKVTVSQTKNLINQTVRISWTGAVPTPPGPTWTNFLQIMQCWGDDPGPDPRQCQFGVIPGVGVQNVAKRQVFQASVDPLEDPIPAGSQANILPFWPVSQKDRPTGLVDSPINPFFDSQITNELPQARTRADGTGEEFLELQTLRQSAGLGCGAPVTVGSAVTGRSCWLVIVPRGSTEVNGQPTPQLTSSPLSRTNWNQKILIKLEFLPVEQSCPIGAAERPVLGNEPVVDAASRWQPALCAGGGAVFSYTQLSDDAARRQLVESSVPGLAVMTNPIPPDQVPANRPVVYAPVALSALTLAFNVERQPFSGVVDALAGARFPEMNLTPRLVAKLLTQSYRLATEGSVDPKYLEGNPIALTRDPEFLKYNPDYERRDQGNKVSQPYVQLGTADTTALLWSWVLGDAEARAFIAGTPDEWGMVVNPANKGLDTPPPTYPLNDQSCIKVQVGDTATGNTKTADRCNSDTHPFTNDMHEAGRAAGRGQDLAKTPIDVAPNGLVVFSKPGPQGEGTRSVMAVVDTATAERYSLPSAKLRNAAGNFVAPTTESMLAGLAAMKASAVPGVLQPDPLTTNSAAYPLTVLSYAATAPAAIDKDAGKDYAAFLRYAAGPGQQPGLAPGQLPFGYVPLPESLRKQTLAAAGTIEAQAGVPVDTSAPPENPASGPVDGPASGPAGAATPNSATTVPSQGLGTSPPAAGAPTGSVPVATPATPTPVSGRAAQPVTAVRRTPALPAPAVGALIVALLVCGGAAAALAPVTRFYGGTRQTGTGEGGDAADRTAAGSVRSWLTARLSQHARRR
jgi:hypothetical protein